MPSETNSIEPVTITATPSSSSSGAVPATSSSSPAVASSDEIKSDEKLSATTAAEKQVESVASGIQAMGIDATVAQSAASSSSSTTASSSSSPSTTPAAASSTAATSTSGELLNGGYIRPGAANDPVTGYYDEIEIEDMEYDSSTSTFFYPCPCGDKFRITKADLLDGEDIARCPSCSLLIKIIYDPDDLEEEDEE